jgi:hypothetical protein
VGGELGVGEGLIWENENWESKRLSPAATRFNLCNDALRNLMWWQIVVFIGVFALRFSIITYPIRSALKVSEDGISATAINCIAESCSVNWWDSRPDFTPKTVTGRQLFHDSLAFWEEQYFNLNAANSVLCLIRILSYLRINPNISQVCNPFCRACYIRIYAPHNEDKLRTDMKTHGVLAWHSVSH